MNRFTSESVDFLADKLLIGLSKDENQLVLDEFEVIESQMNLINEIPNISDVEPMTHPFDMYTTNLREDESEDGETIENILRNSDKTEGREVEVPKVVG